MTSTATWPAHLNNKINPKDARVSHSSAPPEDQNIADRHLHDDAATFLQALLEVRHLLAAEWSADILIALQFGSHRYSELLDKVRASRVIDRRTGRCRYAQTRTFICTLRRMEAVGLVHRSELEGVWPREVHYELSGTARTLLDALSLAIGWHKQHAHPDLIRRATSELRTAGPESL
ncbi:winged helix-turn-helix transcriptional regulator [Kutzneria sp. NPDC052558]|uniref:winged helix-turn-helix transcriptional regulator n=1 Tax=Kutzneria sp. NPDC052558 TaxID=3364121 RepID=UPI0037CB0D90